MREELSDKDSEFRGEYGDFCPEHCHLEKQISDLEDKIVEITQLE